MKSAFEHLSKLHLLPPQKKSENDCRKAIISLLPLSSAIYVSQVFVKNRILYVCVNHEGVIFELDYKLKSVKSIALELIKKMNCDFMLFDKIRVYYKVPEEVKIVKRVWTEKERSDGKFENRLKDEKLFKITENIRALICKSL